MSYSLPLPQSIPILSPLGRAMAKDDSLIFYVLVIFLTAVVLAFKIWGLVALTMTALTFVPVVFALLIWTTLP